MQRRLTTEEFSEFSGIEHTNSPICSVSIDSPLQPISELGAYSSQLANSGAQHFNDTSSGVSNVGQSSKVNTKTAAVYRKMAGDNDDGQTQAKQAVKRRTFHENNIKRQSNEFNDDAIATMTRLTVDDAIKRLNETFDKFEAENIDVVSVVPEEAAQAEYDKYAEVERVYLNLIGKLRLKQNEFVQAERRQDAVGGADNRAKFQVTIDTADILGNIKEPWGIFSGEYAKWRDFRDMFKAGVHENSRIPPTQKFQLLKRALKGDALRVIGAMLTTENNYQKAWDHLCQKYDDDYFAAQEITKRFLGVKNLQLPTHADLRAFLDTILECINQLGAYFEISTWDPLLVFIIIDRLDSGTFGEWEKERIAYVQQLRAENANEAGSEKSCTVPPLNKLLEFLERQARVLMHQQNRQSGFDSSTPTGSRDSSRNRDSSQNRDSNRNRDAKRSYDSIRDRGRSQHPLAYTGAIPKYSNERTSSTMAEPKQKYPPCYMEDCRKYHGLFHCPSFLRLSLAEREKVVRDNGLCDWCMHQHKPGKCKKEREDCRKCQIKGLVHNTTLCKTREILKRTNMMSVIGNSPEPLSMNAAATGAEYLRTQPRWPRNDGHPSSSSRRHNS